MASERSRSPLELPPRTSGKERLEARAEEARESPLHAPERAALRSMPISFGVLVLGLSLTCVLCMLLSGAAYRSVSARAQEASRASQRLDRELSHFKAAALGLQAQLDRRAQDSDAQAREIERLSAELKAVRARAGLDGRAARSRRADNH